MRPTVILDAPSNLGLRPPAPGTVPGCHKLAGALREQRLPERLGAREGGVVVPPRYDRGPWREGDGVFHAAPIAAYTRRLADRIEGHVRDGDFPVVLGGDCSIQLGAALALRRTGRYGVALLDGSSDFRHPGNVPAVGAAGGEELALSTGRGQEDLTDLEGLRPYVRDEDVRLMGVREYEAHRAELAELGIRTSTVTEIRERGAADVAHTHLAALEDRRLDGFWVHFDADVLDPEIMPAVDSPDPGGLTADEACALLRPLLGSPRCAGFNVTVYDPDLDPAGSCAALLADLIESAFTG